MHVVCPKHDALTGTRGTDSRLELAYIAMSLYIADLAGLPGTFDMVLFVMIPSLTLRPVLAVDSPELLPTVRLKMLALPCTAGPTSL